MKVSSFLAIDLVSKQRVVTQLSYDSGIRAKHAPSEMKDIDIATTDQMRS